MYGESEFILCYLRTLLNGHPPSHAPRFALTWIGTILAWSMKEICTSILRRIGVGWAFPSHVGLTVRSGVIGRLVGSLKREMTWKKTKIFKPVGKE